jgi:hypothetical protein
MTRNLIITVAAGALLLASSVSAFAMTKKYHGMSAWALAHGKQVMTDCSVGTVIGGQMVCFSNAREMHRFMKDETAMMDKADGFYREMNFHH